MLTIRIAAAQSLIDPVPDKAALQAGMAAERLPVVSEATQAVAHGVGVFTQDQGASFAR